jgi:hypothetical protein
MVFYGTPSEMLAYFAAAEHEQHFGTELGGCPACGTTRPEFIFDVLETPLRDLSGDIIYEENNQGQLVPARRFSPDYWRDKYESFRLLQDVKQVNLRKQAPQPAPAATPIRKREKIRWHDEWTQFRTLMSRAFMSKVRNRGNLFITLLVAPALAALIGWALYFTDDESGKYDFASAFHIPTYIFISLLVAMFLALMNSVDDIIRDRVVLHRERNLDVRLPYYIFAKFSTLALFSALQCMLFVLVGNKILLIRGMFWQYFFYMFITAASGTSLGLMISSIVADAKTAANFVPLVLIPQLIFGGALIKYEEMNRNLDLIYGFKRWLTRHPEVADSGKRDDSALRVPLISRFVATHYSYEALIVAQAKLNPLTERQDKLQAEMDTLVGRRVHTDAEAARLEDLKDTLALLSGMEAQNPREVEKRLRRVDDVINGKPLDAGGLRSKSGVTAERLYTNQKVTDLVAKAETEQNDYRRIRAINVFFSPEKRYGPIPYYSFHLLKSPHIQPEEVTIKVSVYTYCTSILLGTSFGLMALLYFVLKRQLRPRGR